MLGVSAEICLTSMSCFQAHARLCCGVAREKQIGRKSHQSNVYCQNWEECLLYHSPDAYSRAMTLSTRYLVPDLTGQIMHT